MIESNKPIQQFRLGAIVASVFENEHEGQKYHNVSVTRLYKSSPHDSDWQRTHSFGRDDLPKVSEVAQQAWRFIYELQQTN